MYHTFNFLTGYTQENPSVQSIEWRLIVLESVAGVPGFVAAGTGQTVFSFLLAPELTRTFITFLQASDIFALLEPSKEITDGSPHYSKRRRTRECTYYSVSTNFKPVRQKRTCLPHTHHHQTSHIYFIRHRTQVLVLEFSHRSHDKNNGGRCTSDNGSGPDGRLHC